MGGSPVVHPGPEEGIVTGSAATASDAFVELSDRFAALEVEARGLLAYGDRRLRQAQEDYDRDLQAARSDARRLADVVVDLETRLATATARVDELTQLFDARLPLPALVRAGGGMANTEVARERYLELVKACLTRMLFMNDEPGRDPIDLARQRAIRMVGKDWPEEGETMVGMVRLDCVQQCVETVVREDIPGDLLEAGVWRGGATILMKAVLAAYGVENRTVWVADSFQGLPVPDAVNFPQDVPEDLSNFGELAVSQEQVRANFARYNLLDDRVRFLKGWFKDTLPTAPVDTLAVLRLDGDYYESTIQILDSLYHKVSPGGFVIVDDYGCIEACRQAVTDFRSRHGIDDEIVPVDWTGVYWRRARD